MIIYSNNYSLTLCIHTNVEVDETWGLNCLIMVGAFMGVQPFGCHGKSGIGPKAGGPEYHKRLCNEYSVSNNITAMGGNAALLTSISE